LDVAHEKYRKNWQEGFIRRENEREIDTLCIGTFKGILT
jgi:hypothetical protein